MTTMGIRKIKITFTVILIILVVGVWAVKSILDQIRLPLPSYFPIWEAAVTKVAILPVTFDYSPDDAAKFKIIEEFDLKSFVRSQNTTDYELLKNILRWSSSRWAYDGDHDPQSSDPLVILARGKAGEKFRCVEFGKVTMAGAKVLGLASRVLKLRRKDVEIAEYGAGHVVAEVWLRDLKKWVFVDGQWGVIPELKGKPLSATEFAEAITIRDKDLKFFSVEKQSFVNWRYPAWVAPYLYFMEYDLDQRMNMADRDSARVVLTPVGIPAPQLFQRQKLVGRIYQTSNVSEFEAAPETSSFVR